MKSTIFTFATASSFTRAISAFRSSLTIVATSWRKGLQVTAAVVGLLAAVPALDATAFSNSSPDNESIAEEMNINLGVPCNNYMPRPISGNQSPCPGSIEEYCIQDDGFSSFVWDVPRAFSGNPPIGWKIISGQGTRCVKVLVGTKPGTMKVTVVHPQCGTKVATLPCMPANGFSVSINGPDTVCTSANITYTAVVSDSVKGRGNGHGSIKGDFEYTWSYPAGWTVVSGQGTQTLVITPGATGGSVSVNVVFAPSSNGNGNGNGIGLGLGKKRYCNTNSSNTIDVVISPALGSIGTITGDASFSSCNPIGCGHVYSIAAVSNATDYVWNVPAGMTISSGQGSPSISVCFDPSITAGSYSISVSASNFCGTASTDMEIEVEGCCPNLGTAGPIQGDDFISGCTYIEATPTTSSVPSSPFLCGNGSVKTYTIDPVPGATFYTWSGSSVINIASGQGTNTITVCLDSVIIRDDPTYDQTGRIKVIFGNDCHIDSAFIDLATDCRIFPLPVELVSFDVKPYNGGAMLEWKTSQEIDNKGFEIQRSTDGRNFTAIGWVDGRGNISVDASYTFTDVKKLSGLFYYRLKQIDFSGTSEFSPVRSIKAKINLGELVAYPNPTTGEISLSMPETVASRAVLNLTSIDGKILWTRTLEAGQSVPSSIDLSGYPAGVYLLNLNGDNDQQHLRITKE